MLKIENVVRLDLGIKSENMSRAIEIDCGLWKEQYPNGNINIYHQRPGETAMDVTGATYNSETGVLRWELTTTDTFIDGFGTAEIRMVENNIVKKTQRIVTLIHPSVVDDAGGEIESNQQAYLDAAAAIWGSTQREAVDAHGFATDAEAWAKGTRDGEDVESTDDAYHNNSKYYKEQARSYAASANTAATTAVSYGTTATQKAAQAEASATAAEASKTAASNYSISAAGNASNAYQAKLDAQSAASNASSMASSATSQASRAISAASRASTSENHASSSAEEAAASAAAAGSCVTAAEAARDAAQAAAGDFQGLSATASGLPAGSQPNIEVTHSEGGLYQFAFGIPKGDKGDKGDTGDPAPTAQVTAAVEDWLEENMSNPDSPPLDRSLNLSSAAAPADLVGDLKSAINNENDIIGEVKNIISWDHTVTHSSTKDIIEFHVKAGEKITLEAIASQNVPVQMFVFTGIGTGSTRIATPNANTAVDYTAVTDLMSFGLYVAANNNYNDQDITFVIKKENTLATKTSEAEKNIEQNTNDILLANNKGTQRILPYGNFQSHGLQTDGSFTPGQQYRVSNDDKMSFDYDITINVSSGFRWGYIPFASDVAGAWSGWKTTPYTIPAGTIFNMQIARVTEVYTEIADVKEFTDAITISTISLSRIVSLEQTVNKDFDYSYNGALIETKKGKYNMFQSSLYTPTPASISATSLQGFGIANGYIVQMYSGTTGKLSIVNMATGSVVASIDSNCEHGNSIDFFDTYYADDDILPIAFVSDGLTNRAYEARITASAVTILKNIVFPIETVGYFVSTMLDKNNLIVYTVGYKQNSYTSATNNNMIICAWDYSNLTNNGDSTYTPEFIKSFNVPFFKTLQGPTFHNGKLFIMSSVSSMTEANTRIFVINPYEERIENVLTQFPDNIKNHECEAIYFYETNDEVIAYVRSEGSSLPYYIMEFNS